MDYGNTNLIGVRWTVDDVIHQLNGIRREVITDKVILPKLSELIEYGALLQYPKSQGGTGQRYLFRATKMQFWLEENLKQITDGGWG